MKLIQELLGTVEKRIEEEKEQIYEKFKIKKESLRSELEKKLNADSAAIQAMMAKKNVTMGAVVDSRKEQVRLRQRLQELWEATRGNGKQRRAAGGHAHRRFMAF